MKRAVLVFILALTSFCLAADQTAVIKIDGMTCNSCVGKVKSTLTGIDGVSSADVSLKPGQATVIFADDKIDSKALCDAVAKLGYKVSVGDMSIGEATHCKTEHAEDMAKEVKAALADTKTTDPTKDCPPTCAAKKTCSVAEVAAGCGTSKAKAEMASAKKTKSGCGGMTGSVEVGHHMEKDKMADHTCPTTTKCTEINQFHEAMHPMHVALQNNDLKAVRTGFDNLNAKAKAVADMKCDASCTGNMKEFESSRQVFLENIDMLGKACKGSDDKKLQEKFEAMHDSYIRMANCCM